MWPNAALRLDSRNLLLRDIYILMNETLHLQLSVPPLKLPPSTLGGGSEFNHRHIHMHSPPGELG